MMKYVRTKNGNILNLSRGLTSMIVDKEDIVQQADTIEELCDEFVFHVENQRYWVINNYKRALEIAKSYNEDEIKFICYGAIWTDKGLIYVAKTNKKGELELL